MASREHEGRSLFNEIHTRATTISNRARSHSLRNDSLHQSQQQSQQPCSRITYSPHLINFANKQASPSSLLEVDNKDIDNFTLPVNCRGLNSFWNYGNATSAKGDLYQLAPTGNKRTFNEIINLYTTQRNCVVLMRISSEDLSRFVFNLRTWISITILQRLAEEIRKIDESFKCNDLDMQIGSVDLKRLRKMLSNKWFINTQAPTLPLIVQFLDITDNQMYLVQRIKDLADGWCIANYNWDSGSDKLYFKWNDQLPTDAAIIFHFFCVYFDTQLLPLPHKANRPFYSRYVIIAHRYALDSVAMVNNRAGCAILCTNPLKPNFNFVSHGEIHSCAYDRNNLFYVIIHFLLYMRKYRDNVLEGTSLGANGINIMQVIDN
uniref:Uncharacterized protein n=1 Tax=Glossina morsitans morsitans TaxID=37546 RepID=A0A1B0G556_GLOMM